VFYGSTNPLVFLSREGYEVRGDEITKYMPETFLSSDLVRHELGVTIGYHIIVYNEASFGIVFYITNHPRSYEEDITQNVDHSLGHISMHIDDEDLNIKWIGIKEESRGKGYAKYLMLLGLLYTQMVAPTLTLVKLDDDSDNYANGIENEEERRYAQSKNIYCRLGFEYEDDSGGPEMVGDIAKIVMDNIAAFLRKREGEELERPTTKRRRGGGKRRKKKSNKRKNKSNKRKKKSKKK